MLRCLEGMNAILLALLAQALDVEVDTTEAPDLAEWAAKAKALAVEWLPKIAAALDADAPAKVSLIFKAKQDAPGATAGRRVYVSAPYVRKHPDDWGMLVHELCHVVQAYPEYQPGWLTEGVADYVRDVHFEPGKRKIRIDPKKASYKDAYGTTAAFLAWLEKKSPGAVKALNKAMRAKAYRPELWTEIGGKDVDGLWAEFLKSL